MDHPARTLHEHSEHQRLGHAGQFELAVDDFPECRQLQHHRLQERRDGLLEPGRSDRRRRRRTSAASPRAQVSLNALQGNVISTSTATDLAVQGAGFFVVSDSSGTIYLTRNGSFTPDASGNLVNSAGYYLMAANVQNGVSPLAANSLTGLQKVNVVNAGQTATATTTGSLTANLPSTATPVAPANLPSTNSAGSTYTEATSLVVYDNLGGSHTINHLLHQHRVQHLGGRRVRCVERLRQRRLSLFVRPAGDADP